MTGGRWAEPSIRSDAAVQDVETFTEEWLSGMLLRDLAAKYGRDMSTISSLARRLGLPGRYVGRPRRDDDPVALTGGRWVPGRHGVQFWQAS